MGDVRLNGRIIGCDAVLAVDGEAARIELTLPFDQIEHAGISGMSLVMRVGPNVIWFDTTDPVPAFEALRDHVSTTTEVPVGTPSAAPRPPSGRGRRRRRLL